MRSTISALISNHTSALIVITAISMSILATPAPAALVLIPPTIASALSLVLPRLSVVVVIIVIVIIVVIIVVAITHHSIASKEFNITISIVLHIFLGTNNRLGGSRNRLADSKGKCDSHWCDHKDFKTHDAGVGENESDVILVPRGVSRFDDESGEVRRWQWGLGNFVVFILGGMRKIFDENYLLWDLLHQIWIRWYIPEDLHLIIFVADFWCCE